MTEESSLDYNKNICKNCNGKNYLIQCSCGYCSEIRFLIDKKGRLRKYINHHSGRGINALNFKGRIKHHDYWYLYIPEYFHHTLQNRYISEHVYFYEQYHKCCMLPWGEVHHIEPVTDDYYNNMPWNLQGMTTGQHISHHHKNKIKIRKDMSNRFCLQCGSKQTRMTRNQWQQWYKHKDGFICFKCKAREYKKIKNMVFN